MSASTILFIDDDQDLLALLSEILRRAGYQVLTAGSSFDGMKQAHAARPDLILCDVMMPEPDGFEVRRRLAETPETAAIPFVFLTARNLQADKLLGLQLGADDYIVKPFDHAELLARLQAVLRRAEAARRSAPSALSGGDQAPQARILLVTHLPVIQSALAGVLGGAGHLVRTAYSGDQAMESILADPPEVVVVDLAVPGMDGLQFVRNVRSSPAAAGIGLIALVERNDLEHVSAVFKAGADEFVIKERGADQDLLKKCGGLLKSIAHARAVQAAQAGRLISFFSAKGGLGTSALCVNLAYAVAQQIAPRSALVADLVLPLGSIGLMTGTPADNSIVGLTNEHGALTPELVKHYLAKPEGWDLSVLPGPRTPREAQSLDINHLEPVFTALRTMFDYTLVDFGRTLSRVSQPLLRASNAVVVVLGPDVVSVRLTAAALEHLVGLGIEKSRLFLILNRAVGREGLTKPEIEKQLGLTIPGAVPYAQDNFTLSINQHQPYSKRFAQDTSGEMVKRLATLLMADIEKRDVRAAA